MGLPNGSRYEFSLSIDIYRPDLALSPAKVGAILHRELPAFEARSRRAPRYPPTSESSTQYTATLPESVVRDLRVHAFSRGTSLQAELARRMSSAAIGLGRSYRNEGGPSREIPFDLPDRSYSMGREAAHSLGARPIGAIAQRMVEELRGVPAEGAT